MLIKLNQYLQEKAIKLALSNMKYERNWAKEKLLHRNKLISRKLFKSVFDFSNLLVGAHKYYYSQRQHHQKNKPVLKEAKEKAIKVRNNFQIAHLVARVLFQHTSQLI